jgi:NAD(P)-dependent dehydrogenase (short-subunit alcohol dehydrogenase family)
MTQYVLISGASSGIGKAAAQSLAANGITVFAGALNDAEAEAMRAEGIKNIVPLVLDVTRLESIDAAMQTVAATIGKDSYLHGLVSCAGVDVNAPLHVLERTEIMHMINVNYVGGIMLTRAALPLMRHGSSRLVFISSAMAVLSTPTISIYCSTKSGISGFADAMRVELIPVGLKVSVIEPGVIRTPMVRSAPLLLEKMLARMTDADRKCYEPMMKKIAQMSANPKGGSSTDLTSKAISHALTAAKPKIRYRVGVDSKAASIIGKFPYAVKDWIQRKIYGI